jgi:hypothetical protein
MTEKFVAYTLMDTPICFRNNRSVHVAAIIRKYGARIKRARQLFAVVHAEKKWLEIRDFKPLKSLMRLFPLNTPKMASMIYGV